MSIYRPSAEKKPNTKMIYTVTGVSEVKETELKPGAPKNFKWFNVELQPEFNAVGSRIFVMLDADMFLGGNPIGDAEDVLEQPFNEFRRSREAWAAIADPEHGEEKYLAVRAGAFTDHAMPHRGRKTSTLQAIFEKDYDAFLSEMEELGEELTVEAIAQGVQTYIDGASKPIQLIANMKQATEKNADGSKSLTDFYEVNGVQRYTEETREYFEDQARKSARGELNYEVEVAWEVAA